LADQVLAGELPKETKARVENWARWEGGAIPGKVFLALLEKAGFEESELVMETGFNSSPVTKGVLFRAIKPIVAAIRERIKPTAVAARREDKMEYLLQQALELGAEKAKIIDTETVVVEEWVRWKCAYGCPLYDKDAFHPPFAPDAETTKKVLGEYTKAILLNGPNGQTLSEAAVKLEGEAYHRGYYKAFALTALVPSGGAACAPVSSSGATWPSGETQAPAEPAKVEEVKPEEPSPGGGWPSGQAEAPGEPLKVEEVKPAPSPGGTWPAAAEAQAGSQRGELTKLRIRPMMEACGIDVFKTARHNGFDIDTRKETYGRWNYFALVLIE
jgi:predicted metal-binding protein